MITVLVVGGTSGLGLELTNIFAVQSILSTRGPIKVIATGRHDPEQPRFEYRKVDLTSASLESDLTYLVRREGKINLVVYAAGYYQEKPIEQLTDREIGNMLAVGIQAPALLLSRILRDQGYLPGLIYISSTSAWKPRPNEPIYAATKAGAEHLVQSVSESGKIGKTLIAAPGGMKNTSFYEGTDRNTSAFLDPQWVAVQIFEYFSQQQTAFQCIDILNDPPRVEERREREKRQLSETK